MTSERDGGGDIGRTGSGADAGDDRAAPAPAPADRDRICGGIGAGGAVADDEGDGAAGK